MWPKHLAQRCYWAPNLKGWAPPPLSQLIPPGPGCHRQAPWVPPDHVGLGGCHPQGCPCTREFFSCWKFAILKKLKVEEEVLLITVDY